MDIELDPSAVQRALAIADAVEDAALRMFREDEAVLPIDLLAGYVYALARSVVAIEQARACEGIHDHVAAWALGALEGGVRELRAAHLESVASVLRLVAAKAPPTTRH